MPINVDYGSLGLQFPVKDGVEFTVQRVGWAPPPAQPPSLPFMVLSYLPHHLLISSSFYHDMLNFALIL